MVWVIHQLNETVLFIKGSRAFVEGVDLDRAHAHLICDMLGAPQSIDEK